MTECILQPPRPSPMTFHVLPVLHTTTGLVHCCDASTGIYHKLGLFNLQASLDVTMQPKNTLGICPRQRRLLVTDESAGLCVHQR
jgi:hypothetical protein